MSAVQEFLRNGGTLDELTARYSIVAKRHREHPSLVLLKYNQIASPFAEPIVRCCRGVILDESDDWRIVSRPFDKFFNHGEGLAAPIDWATARVQEKLDGSLCTLYRYRGAWNVATSGTPDASGDVNGMGVAFGTLFWDVFHEMGLSLPPSTWADYSFMFELTTPWNRVVVKHADRRLTLLAVRNRMTGDELPVEDVPLAYPKVRSFPLQSFDDIAATFANLDPLAQEGYVIVDGAFRRVKVKHPGYVAIHHLKDGMCPRRIVEVVRAGETAELLAHFPEWKGEFDAIQARYDALVAEVEADYERLRAIPVQKDFALQAVRTVSSGTLFMLRAGKTPSVREHFASVTVYRLMDLLHIKDAPPTEEDAA